MPHDDGPRPRVVAESLWSGDSSMMFRDDAIAWPRANAASNAEARPTEFIENGRL